MGYLPKRGILGSGTSPWERSMLPSTKLNRIRELKSVSTQNVEFAQLAFGLVLAQVFSSLFYILE